MAESYKPKAKISIERDRVSISSSEKTLSLANLHLSDKVVSVGELVKIFYACGELKREYFSGDMIIPKTAKAYGEWVIEVIIRQGAIQNAGLEEAIPEEVSFAIIAAEKINHLLVRNMDQHFDKDYLSFTEMALVDAGRKDAISALGNLLEFSAMCQDKLSGQITNEEIMSLYATWWRMCNLYKQVFEFSSDRNLEFSGIWGELVNVGHEGLNCLSHAVEKDDAGEFSVLDSRLHQMKDML